MARKVKVIIHIEDEKEKHQVFIPASTAPRLKYHGIDPEHFAGLEIDVYMPTGKKTGMGFEMKYSHTIFPKQGKTGTQNRQI